MTHAPAEQPFSAPGLDVDALEALAVSEGPALFRMARSLVRDDDRAQDLVQQAFLRALERRDTFRGGDAAAWLRRILWNLALDQVRRGGREVPVEEIEERWASDDYTVDAERVVARAEMREELEDALIRLPFAYRSVVVLHDVEGWTVARIADALDIGLPAAKQRLRRGRMAMVSSLAQGAERREALAGVPLRCWDARRHVSEYLNGELGGEERAAMGELRDPDSVIPPRLGERIAAALA